MMESDAYLIWSHKKGMWWMDEAQGYTPRLSEAGRYSRADALMHCTCVRHGVTALPSLPVRLDDLLVTLRGSLGQEYERGTGPSGVEPWE